MSLHPVEIAKELRNFAFFKTFSDEMLLQISTMTVEKNFKASGYILREGELNTKLYFLRSGVAEITLENEVVAILQTVGDVMGEMSVVLKRPVTSSIIAKTDLSVFVIDSDHFSHVPQKDFDRFNSLLYRVYSTVLADRLIRTNEKARLFEIANRELFEAQATLEKAGDKSVLLIDTDRKQLVLAKMAVGSSGVRMDVASDVESAKQLLLLNKYDLIVFDDTCADIADSISDIKKAVMITNKKVQGNIPVLKKNKKVNNLITRDPEDKQLTIKTLLTTLSKLLNNDVFGIEKYLAWGVDIQNKKVTSSSDRMKLKDDMVVYFKRLGIRNTILEKMYLVTEELLMNAIYDAPTDKMGKALYNHLPRKVEVVLDSHLQSVIKYGCDGIYLAVSVTDPFGSLTKDIIINYLDSCYSGQAGSLNQGKGGAGRGLHQIVENSDLTIFNVKPGQRTEVISIFLTETNKKEPNPSFHYFFNE
ncbi:MAG: cyclic nucleotide-binding domain-containing protein [Bdellovibrionaceae bacterium]|nr:cyclic nucleotide-binding domain-containing protein [Pseudobdellovibrionaceae bacterium]